MSLLSVRFFLRSDSRFCSFVARSRIAARMASPNVGGGLVGSLWSCIHFLRMSNSHVFTLVLTCVFRRLSSIFGLLSFVWFW